MIDRALRWLKLERRDLVKVGQFAGLAFLLQAGLSIGMSAGDALFLSGFGAEKLPYVFMATAGAMLVYTPVMAAVSHRSGATGALLLALGVLIAGGGMIWAGVTHADALPPTLAAVLGYGVRIYAAVWFIGIYTLFWNFVDDYFDVQDGKRLFAMLSAGAALGGMAGGGLVTRAAGLVPVGALYLVWAALALLTLPLVLHIGRRWRRLAEHEDAQEETGGGFAAILDGVRQSRYVPMVVGVFLLSLLLGNLNEFQYMTVFGAGRGEEELARLFGQLYGIASGLTLFINLFVFNHLVLRIGVRSVALLVPAAYVALFTLYFADFGMAPALVGFLLLQGIVPAIDFNNFNFLFNAIDARFRKQIRTVVEGLCEPFATCAAGLGLLLVQSRIGAESLSSVGILGAAGLILLVVALRGAYRETMVHNLRRGWLDFSGGRTADGGDGADAAMRALVADPAAPEDIRVAALDLLLRPNRWSIADLELLLRFVEGAGETGQLGARPLLRRMLEAGAGKDLLRLADNPAWARLWDRPAIVAELGAHQLLDRVRMDAILARMDDRAMTAAAVVALWNSSDPAHCRLALDRLAALRSGDEGERLAAVQVLGRLGEDRFAHLLAGFLTDAAAEVRTGALAALRDIGPLRTMHLVAPILAAIRRASPEARGIGIQVLASSGDPAVLIPLLDLADLLTPLERRVMEQAAVGLGAAAVPTLASVLQERRRGFSSRAIAARALARLSPAQFVTIVQGLAAAELDRAYAAERQSLSVPDAPLSPGAEVLRRVYQDQERDCLDFALLLMTLNGGLPDFELLTSTLRSANPKVRGNALETLEQAADYREFARIRGLIDADLKVQRRSGLRPPDDPSRAAALFRAAMRSDTPLEAAAAAQALWDLEGDRALPALRARLRDGGQDVAQQTVLDLLGLETSAQRLTLVARLAALCRCELFETLALRDLLTISAASEQCAIEDTHLFEPGERADSLFVVLRGTVDRTCGGATTRCAAPSLVGAEALHADHYAGEAYMPDGEVLVVPAAMVLTAAAAYPRLAARLFQSRLAA